MSFFLLLNTKILNNVGNQPVDGTNSNFFVPTMEVNRYRQMFDYKFFKISTFVSNRRNSNRFGTT